MRKTLTIDDDVAGMLRELSKSRYQTLTKTVNETLRLGISEIEAEAEAEKSRSPRRKKQ